MKLTQKIKLIPNKEQKELLLNTMERFNEACNYISKIAYDEHTASQVKLHKLAYYDVIKKFELSAQMTIRALGKVAESYKRDKNKHHQFRPRGAMVYDARIYSFKSADTISILTLGGRQIIPFMFKDYRQLNIEIRRVKGQADLIFKIRLFIS